MTFFLSSFGFASQQDVVCGSLLAMHCFIWHWYSASIVWACRDCQHMLTVSACSDYWGTVSVSDETMHSQERATHYILLRRETERKLKKTSHTHLRSVIVRGKKDPTKMTHTKMALIKRDLDPWSQRISQGLLFYTIESVSDLTADTAHDCAKRTFSQKWAIHPQKPVIWHDWSHIQPSYYMPDTMIPTSDSAHMWSWLVCGHAESETCGERKRICMVK